MDQHGETRDQHGEATAPDVLVHPLVSPWGRFGLYSYFIDAPEPAIVDTGITSSPEGGMAPAIERIGRRIEDVKWILLTHGHIDHMGGAHALWELTGRKAEVVLHRADAHLLRSRQEHVDLYLDVRQQYLGDPEGEAKQTAAGEHAISGEMERTALILVGRSLGQAEFGESRLYAADYDRRYRPVGTAPRFPGT